MSFLSKAYNFLKGKTSANDENFYAKSKTPFPNEIYPILSEPIDHKRLPSISRKNRKVLGDISNRSWSVGIDRERKQQRESLEGFSPRALVKNYWVNNGEKKLNNEVQQTATNRISREQGEDDDDDDDEEGVFKIQLIKPQNGFLGIVLVGGADTPLENHYVNDILPNSSASKSGRVRGGDELLEANGQALRGKSHAEALTIFRSLPAVVELMVARTKDANRAILERLNHEKKDNKKVNNNIASPKRRRSVIEEAAKTSVIPRSLSSVIDVTKKSCPYVKPVKRVSRVSSFVGTEENEVRVNNAVNLKDDKRKGNQEATSEQKDNKFNGMEEVYILSTSTEDKDYGGIPLWSKTPDSLSLKSFPRCESVFDLPQIHEDETVRYATIRRSRTLNASMKRRSVIEQGNVRETWPAFTTKQRLPLPWDSYTSPRPATVGRSSSVRVRRSIATTSATNLTLQQSSSTRKLTGKHYIERKTLTVEIERESTSADWGFTIGGGIFSPYGDLPIFIADISPSGGALGLLQNGDEIVDFSGESFEGATFLEAAKMLTRCTKRKVTVTIKRKFLQRCQNPQSNPYIEAWSSFNTTTTMSGCKQKRRPKSMHS